MGHKFNRMKTFFYFNVWGEMTIVYLNRLEYFVFQPVKKITTIDLITVELRN